MGTGRGDCAEYVRPLPPERIFRWGEWTSQATPVPKPALARFLDLGRCQSAAEPTLAAEEIPAKPAQVLRPVLLPTEPPVASEETASTCSSEEEPVSRDAVHAAGPEIASAPWLIGEAIAFDEDGQPIILKQVDPETGKPRHVVRNADGSLHTFGQRTVDSLLDSEELRARRWVKQLSSRDLRGLVHTLGHRLLQSSQLYQQRHVALLNLSDLSEYAFFGLSPNCSEHDLDVAYRRLAKQMHPDKNGGTDYAKKRFQNMKERYEALKRRRQERQTGDGEREEGVENERSEVQGEGDNGRIEFDPADRASLNQTVWKMVHQLRTLQQGLEEISRRLSRCQMYA